MPRSFLGEHVGPAASEARARVIGQVTHHRISQRVPRQSDAQGQSRIGGPKPEHLRVIEHREVRDAVHGDGNRALAEGVAEDAAQRSRRGGEVVFMGN
jgi:hypothetical protein